MANDLSSKVEETLYLEVRWWRMPEQSLNTNELKRLVLKAAPNICAVAELEYDGRELITMSDTRVYDFDYYGQIGDRVMMSPSTDQWAKGDRYGTIENRNDTGYLWVRLDKSQSVVKTKTEWGYCTPVDSKGNKL